jgi:hypothetical protein
MHKLLGLLFLVTTPVFAQWSLVGPRGFNSFTTWDLYVALDSAQMPYVSFIGWKGGATVMAYNGSWDTVGKRNFSEGMAKKPKIVFESHNIPIIAYGDITRHSRISARYFSGSNWDSIGNLAFTDGPSSSSDIAINPVTNEPYIVYRDRNRQFRCTVMKFNGASWEFVGTPGFSDIGNGWEGALNNKIVFDSQGTPYVTFTDCSIGWRASVARFDGFQWVFLGGMGCTPGSAGTPTLMFDHNDQLYLAFSDQTKASRISVMQWNGSNWNYVGTPGFSAGSAGYINLVCDGANDLFVGYNDFALHDYAVVKKYSHGIWTNLGDSVVSEAEAHYINLVMDKQGTAYLAYADGGVSYHATMKKFVNAGQAVGITEDSNEKFQFSILPNPSNGIISCSFSNILNENYVLSVENALGATLLTQPLPDLCEQLQLDLSPYPKGIYFIRIKGNKLHSVEKLVIQ